MQMKLPRHLDDLDTDAKNAILDQQLAIIEERRKDKEVHPMLTWEEKRTKIGKPLAYATPEMLAMRVDSYFEEIEEHNKKEISKKNSDNYYRMRLQTPTALGLSVFLDIDMGTVLDYEKRDGYSPILHKAKRKCELGITNSALQGDSIASVATLVLKNMHNWKDKQETDITTGGVPFTIARKTFIQPSSIDSIDGEVSDA